MGGATVDVETQRKNEMYLGFTHILGWDACGSSHPDERHQVTHRLKNHWPSQIPPQF